jgi:hypothetical protein
MLLSGSTCALVQHSTLNQCNWRFKQLIAALHAGLTVSKSKQQHCICSLESHIDLLQTAAQRSIGLLMLSTYCFTCTTAPLYRTLRTQTVPLTKDQWISTVLMGALALPLGIFMRLLPPRAESASNFGGYPALQQAAAETRRRVTVNGSAAASPVQGAGKTVIAPAHSSASYSNNNSSSAASGSGSGSSNAAAGAAAQAVAAPPVQTLLSLLGSGFEGLLTFAVPLVGVAWYAADKQGWSPPPQFAAFAQRFGA